MLDRKTALVTGAAGGLGRAICAALARAGATVIGADIAPDAYIHMDVTSKASITAAFQAAGPVDILVNNAGGSLYTPKQFEAITEADWDLVTGVNLKGAFLCCQAAVPGMRARGGGRIINVSSIGGRMASPVTGVAYAAAKAGLIGLTRRLALELGPDNIQVNAIAPGTVLSGERMRNLWNELPPAEQEQILNAVPLGRLSTPEEQADVVLFLAGPASRYITGAVIDVNGGRHMG